MQDFLFINKILSNTVFENHRKSLISHFLRLYFKVDEKCQKWSNLGKVEACGQTVLPDMYVLIRRKCDILNNFQTLCKNGLNFMIAHFEWTKVD